MVIIHYIKIFFLTTTQEGGLQSFSSEKINKFDMKRLMLYKTNLVATTLKVHIHNIITKITYIDAFLMSDVTESPLCFFNIIQSIICIFG